MAEGGDDVTAGSSDSEKGEGKQEEQGQEVEQGQTTQAPDQHQNAAQQVLAQLGEESEDDEEGEEQTNKRKRDDEEFLDDRGVSKEEREEARRELDLQAAPQAEEGEEEEAGPEEHEEETGSRKKKKKKGKKSEEELRMEVETMVARMQVAADRDTKAHRSGKPGMNKLHLLPEVSYMLRRHDLQSLLVDPSLGVLDAIRRWISPLDTGVLPNSKVRGELLDCLGKLPVDLDDGTVKEQLKRTGLGKLVAFYANLPDETLENRRLASEVENKWMRQLYRLEDRHRAQVEDDIAQQADAPKGTTEEKQSREAGDIGDEDEDEEDKGTMRFIARKPKEASMDYRRRPAPAVPPERLKSKSHHGGGKLAKASQRLKQQTKEKAAGATDAAVKVSVQGSGIFHMQ